MDDGLVSDPRYLRDIVSALPDPVFVLSEDGEYLSVFGGTDERYYHDGSGLVGLCIHDILPPEKAAWFQEQIDRTLESGRMHIVEYTLSSFEVDGLEEKKGPAKAIHFEGRVQALAEPVNGKRAVLWVAQNITERHRLERELRALSEHDMLTNTYNRRRLFQELDRLLEVCRISNRPSAVILFDIDLFKSINDRCGHDTGDKVLRAVADIAQSVMRSGDLLVRYGGDEFIILMPGADAQAGAEYAERFRKEVRARTSAFEACPLGVSISAGVSELTVRDLSAEAVISRADRALYASKKGGRDRISIEA